MNAPVRRVELAPEEGSWSGRFRAMAGTCEVLVETRDADEARVLAEQVASCAWRIEDKYSRYLAGSVVDAINSSDGSSITVDEETANLLDFAVTLHRLSDGLFDITSGVLRRAWTFDGTARIPSQAAVEALLPLVGWNKVAWRRPELRLRPGMQIDFGGIGKEYAVDLSVLEASRASGASALVNFGGDLAVTRPRSDGRSWRVGIEDPAVSRRSAVTRLDLRRGALATSGDTHRFLMADGKRYSHILDPRTGWPIRDAPRSVTVAAASCTQAGMLTTMAVLQGANAEGFLAAEGVPHWIRR